jgi:hypothetical protein
LQQVQLVALRGRRTKQPVDYVRLIFALHYLHVEGKRLAAMKAAETRRLKPTQKDHEQFEQDRNSWLARLGEFLDWWSTHLKFRSWVSASAAWYLSRLNSLPHTIVVYASQWSSPSTTQHSLPSAPCTLPRPDLHRLEHASLFGAPTAYLLLVMQLRIKPISRGKTAQKQ